MSERCETCRFWFDKAPSADPDRNGECRRHPPVVIVIGNKVSGEHPPAEASCVCGDYQPHTIFTAEH